MKYLNIAILLGRKGSRGIPGKNVMDILGRPALHYPILAAKNSRYIDDIFVSTDDEEIINEAKKFDLKIINRPSWLCTDEALFEDALVHAYREIKEKVDLPIGIVVILMCNAVTVDSRLIDEAIEALNNDKQADSAVSVSVFNMYSPIRARRKNKQGYLVPFFPLESLGGDISKLSCDRASQGDAFFADMSHSVVRAKCLENIDKGLLPQRWMGRDILPIYNSCGCDMDEPWQVDMSIRWLRDRGFTSKKTPYEQPS